MQKVMNDVWWFFSVCLFFLNIDSEFCNVTRINKLLLMNIEILSDLRLLLCSRFPKLPSGEASVLIFLFIDTRHKSL